MAKALLLANAIAGASRAQQGKPAALEGLGSTFNLFGYGRSIMQGACAGLLTLMGTLHLTEAWPLEQQSIEGLTQIDGTGVEGLIEASLAGGVPGLVEILGAIALFLSAGRGSGRLIGLMGFIAILVGHANGVTHDDLFEHAGELLEFVQNTAQKIQATQNA